MIPEAGSSFTARELAQACGLRARNVQRLARREDWPYVEERFPGGQRRQYPLAGLPLDIAAKALRWRAAESAAESIASWTPPSDFDYDSEALWREAAKRSTKHREEGEFRARILREVEALMQGEGLPFLKAARRVAAGTGRTAAAIRDWHYGRKVRGSRRRGARDYAPADRAAALIPRHAESGRPRKELPPEIERVFIALDRHQRNPPVASSYRLMLEAAETAGEDTAGLPSLRTMHSWVSKGWLGSRAVRIMTRTRERDRSQALAATVPKLRRDKSGLRVGEEVCGDGLTVDRCWVEFPDGSVRHPVVWVFEDVRSRCLVAYDIGKVEDETRFRRAAQKLLFKFMPERIRLDNTMAAMNKRLTAGMKGRKRFKDQPGDPPGLLTRLGVEVHSTDVSEETRNSGAKTIERAFGTGGVHDVVHDPHIRDLGLSRDRPVPYREFCAAFRRAVRRYNRRIGRRGFKLGASSYQEVYDKARMNPANPFRELNPYQREMILRVPQRRRVESENWEVRVRIAPGDEGLLRYIDPELLEWAGEEVIVWFNPDRTGQDALVETLDGKRICSAECLPDAAYGSVEAAGQTQRRKRRFNKATKVAAEAEEQLNSDQLAESFPEVAEDSEKPAKVSEVNFEARKERVARAARSKRRGWADPLPPDPYEGLDLSRDPLPGGRIASNARRGWAEAPKDVHDWEHIDLSRIDGSRKRPEGEEL